MAKKKKITSSEKQTKKEAKATNSSTAVVVRNQIGLTVGRILTGTDPRDWRHLCPRWTGRRRTAAAAAQETIDGAVPPVVTAQRIIGRRRLNASCPRTT